MQPGTWLYSRDHNEAGRLVSTEEMWGERYSLIWLPSRDTVVRVAEDRLRPLADIPPASTAYLAFVGAAARIADALERDALVAPLEGTVIPLPHQIHALSRAMSGDRVRYLLADEVGLGKTVEAGLAMRELKIRGLVRRILVVAPAGLVTQWVSEMRNHFREDFRLVLPGDFAAWRKIAGVGERENLWRLHDQVVCPIDSVKPMDSRRGWSSSKVARYNRERFEDLVTAGWDLIVIDEAHRLGRQHRAGRALSPRGGALPGGALPAVAVGHAAPGQDGCLSPSLELHRPRRLPRRRHRNPRQRRALRDPHGEAQHHRCQRLSAVQGPAAPNS